MNEIQITYDWLINHFKDSDLVNTVSILPTSELDQNKENIYPLVNIDFLNKETDEQAINTTFKISIMSSIQEGFKSFISPSPSPAAAPAATLNW